MTKQQMGIAILLAAAFVGASCSDSLGPVAQRFGATLTGDQERPNPVTTTASGSSDVTILDTNLIRVETRVSTIDSVTQSHIHAGDANTAGPIMLFLLSNVAAGRAPITGTNVTLSVVDVNRATPACGANGIPTPCFQGVFTLDSLLFRIRNNIAYVNVHTRKNGGGEIRGQIVPK